MKVKKIILCVSFAFIFLLTACAEKDGTGNNTEKSQKQAVSDTETVSATPTASATSTPDISDEYIFPDSDKRELENQEIQKLSKKKKRFARNEIYARHGYIFDDFELSEYFEKKSWYVPQVEAKNFDQNVLNDVEKANIKKLLGAESGKADLKRWAGTYRTKADSSGSYLYVTLTIKKNRLVFENGSYNTDNGGRMYCNGEAKIIDANTAKFVDEIMNGTMQLSNDGKQLTVDAVALLSEDSHEEVKGTYTKKEI